MLSSVGSGAGGAAVVAVPAAAAGGSGAAAEEKEEAKEEAKEVSRQSDHTLSLECRSGSLSGFCSSSPLCRSRTTTWALVSSIKQVNGRRSGFHRSDFCAASVARVGPRVSSALPPLLVNIDGLGPFSCSPRYNLSTSRAPCHAVKVHMPSRMNTRNAGFARVPPLSVCQVTVTVCSLVRCPRQARHKRPAR